MFGYFQISTRTKLTFFTTTHLHNPSPLPWLLAPILIIKGVAVFIHVLLPTGPCVVSLFPTHVPVCIRHHLLLFWAFVPAHCPLHFLPDEYLLANSNSSRYF